MGTQKEEGEEEDIAEKQEKEGGEDAVELKSSLGRCQDCQTMKRAPESEGAI